ncbi:protoporphyrinogen oxidase [Macrococcus hajekii]|uniref:Coproporphyrinogen III oxidase n=1 Tax=Macrococcus hajekii TaxID=198482 RepID=A0A4R6BLL2_9STAP|nr:protoporphyrinogen oxidase [Macrococcus hajekii]TDM02588.1 protoporphyrinogen oxidase [Macrococcus hajekii]GGB02175.1 protoporphyrinogen oxidase [Macrococcus hajekii]
MKKVAIIGAGITGLSAAYYLENADIDILEQSDRPGGKVKTYQRDGYTIELGPESYIARKTIMTELATAIGLGDDIVKNETGQSYVYANNKLYPIPGGSIMGIPTEIGPFLETKLLSPVGKVRAGLDYFIKPKPMTTDVSVGAFFRKRLGNEALENLIEPLLSGIYGADIDKLSLKSTFPNFKEQEEAYGSLIKGMRAQKKIAPKVKAEAKKVGQFRQFKNGLQSFIDRLAEVVTDQGAHIQYNSTVSAIRKVAEGYEVTVNGKPALYDHVIVTVPHTVFSSWFEDTPLRYFKHMETTSVATVVMAFDESQVNNEENGTGFVIARNSDTVITACTWTSKKWAHSTPEGKVLLRAYVGRPGDTVVKDNDDESLIKLARQDLDKMMDIKGEPDFAIVTRLMNSMPQYEVGHIDRVRHIQRYMAEHYPGLILTGASFEAVGLPDCISQAKAAAEQLNH